MSMLTSSSALFKLCIFLWSVTLTEQMTFENWKQMYCPVYTLKCYDGHCCKYGEQYCSRKSESCEAVFSPGLNMEGKLSECCEKLVKNNSSSIEELSTACFYLFGKNNFADKCNGHQITSVASPENLPVSTSEIVAWIIVIILFLTTAGLTLKLKILKWHESKKIQLDKEEIIKASSNDKNLVLLRQLSQEKADSLNDSTEEPTELKQVVVQRSDEQQPLLDEINGGRQTQVLQQKNTDARGGLHLSLTTAENDLLVNDTQENSDLQVATTEAGNGSQMNYRDARNDPQLNHGFAGGDLQIHSRDERAESPLTSRDERVDSPLTFRDPMKRTTFIQNILFSPADPDVNTIVSPSGVGYSNEEAFQQRKVL
ncbi:hypothetical protein Btru_055185 [Bulinus truncatus]|nr:hypothetical protein Btru_055185 [Bulinus truncatus]